MWKNYLYYTSSEPGKYHSLANCETSVSHTKFSIDYDGPRYFYYLKDIESLEEKMKTPEGQSWVRTNRKMLEKKVKDFPDLLCKMERFEQYRM